MTNKEAIKLIGDMKSDLSDFYDYDDLTALEMAISALSENKGEWIPVSERLPEDSQRVNITIQRSHTVYVTTATWDEMRGYFYNLGHAFDDVVAWRELPEPYQKGGE